MGYEARRAACHLDGIAARPGTRPAVLCSRLGARTPPEVPMSRILRWSLVLGFAGAAALALPAMTDAFARGGGGGGGGGGAPSTGGGGSGGGKAPSTGGGSKGPSTGGGSAKAP